MVLGIGSMRSSRSSARSSRSRHNGAPLPQVFAVDLHDDDKFQDSRKAGFSWYILFSTLLASLSAANIGWAIGVTNSSRSIIGRFDIPDGGSEEPTEFPNHVAFSVNSWSVAVGVLSIGGLIGSLVSGAIANSIGRRNALVINNGFFLAGSVLMGTSTTAVHFTLGRFVLGIGCGIASSVANIFIAEISPVRWHGFYGAFFQFSLVLGLMCAQLASIYSTNGTQWRIAVSIPGVLSIVQIALLPLRVESPSYLIKARHVNEARHALLKLRRGYDVAAEWQEILDSLDSGEQHVHNSYIDSPMTHSSAPNEPHSSSSGSAVNDSDATMKCIITQAQQLAKINATSSVAQMQQRAVSETGLCASVSVWQTISGRTRHDLRHLVLCCTVLMALQQLAGISSVLFGGGEFVSMILDSESSLSGPWACIVVCFISLPALLLCMMWVDKLGRRPMLLGSLGGMAVCSMLASVGLFCGPQSMVMAAVFLGYFLFNMGVGTIPWFFISECVPAYALTSTTVLGCSLNWIIAIGLGLLMPVIEPAMAGSDVESPSIISGRDPIAYSTSNPLVLFIIQLMIIVCLCRFLHVFLKRIHQPSVISEIIGGILLGPTVLGRWKAFSTHVFPTASLVNLNLVANFGLVLFLFMIGLELDPQVLKRNLHRSIAISAAGMVLPFALGIASSFALFHILMDGEGRFHIFLLFLGVAMAITAFPVLGRILSELNLLKTTVGSTAMSAAAIDDVTSWCLLALVIALTNNSSGLTALWALLVGAGWTLFVLFAVRPVYLWYLRRNGCLRGREPSQMVLFVTFMMVLISAFFTDIIGIHAIFGGFIVGVIVPHDGGFAIKVTERIEDVVQIFFLPIYFALSGLKTNLSALDDGKTWGLLFLVIFVAFFGKAAGCTLAARMSKFTWRESLTIGFLMDCKGLVELIVLNIGLQAGVIDTRIFTMMVVMALVTTFITAPAVVWLYPPKYQKRLEGQGVDDDADSIITKRHGPEAGAPMRILVVLSRLPQVPAIMTLLSYLHHQPELASARRLTLQESGADAEPLPATKRQPYRPVRVFGLRLLEQTAGRDSSVMQQHESESRVLSDPVMSMFRTFARVANMVFHASLSYSDREHFVDSVLGSAQDAAVEMTIVSAFGRNSKDNGVSGAVLPGWFESMGWGFTTEQQAAFITDMFDRAQSHVGVFIDCGMAEGTDASGHGGGGVVPSAGVSLKGAIALTDSGDIADDQSVEKSKVVAFATADTEFAWSPPQAMYFADGRKVPLVVVPFFGGPDDRQALRLAADLCTHSAVQVLVWRFVKTEEPTPQDVLLSEDRFPARPIVPQTPAAVHHSDEQSAFKLDLAATRVGGDEQTSKDEAAERDEDDIFIATAISPVSLGERSKGAGGRRDSIASGLSTAITPESSPKGMEAAQGIAAPPSLQPQLLGQIATRESETGGNNGVGGIRHRITQKLRLRSQTPAAGSANDELVWGSDKADMEGLVSTLSAGLRATRFPNMTIETVHTGTPLQTLLLRARSLSAQDLIICGRSVRSNMAYYNNAQELSAHTPAGHAHTKIDRQRALGTVTEYLLGFGTNASILVVQTSKNALGVERLE
ncbi:hypothetical protein GGI07_001490 [Coemansia sp. Benny D115]|nr:hypothetical protein GGI07_001490 [Coemansia sp. Benny D115]